MLLGQARMSRLACSSLLIVLISGACSSTSTGGSRGDDGSPAPATEAGAQLEATSADVPADGRLDQTLADRSLDDGPADRGVDRAEGDRVTDLSQPDDRFGGLICESPDAGAGCGAAGQQCCKTANPCRSGLVCTVVNTCDPQPCGNFLQQCCCRGGFRNGCAPDLLCRSGTCGQP
jgi:hypothetical protein